MLGESSSDPSSTPLYAGLGRDPLEVYWLLTTTEDEVPTELISNYERRGGDVQSFFANAAPRGSGLVTDVTAPPPPPQKSKWWTESCGTSSTEYDYVDCEWGTVTAGTQYHRDSSQPFALDNEMAYSIARDTLDQDREVRIRWTNSTALYCSGFNSAFVDDGAWAVYEYEGVNNYSWEASIDGGCDGTCYEFGSVFFWNDTQSSTCGYPVG